MKANTKVRFNLRKLNLTDTTVPLLVVDDDDIQVSYRLECAVTIFLEKRSKKRILFYPKDPVQRAKVNELYYSIFYPRQQLNRLTYDEVFSS